MRIIVVLSVTLLVASCTTSQFHGPNVSRSDKISIRTCGHIWETFRREVAPGVVIELWPHTALLRLDENKTARFISDRVTIMQNGQNLESTIYKITAGPLFEEEARFYNVDAIEFEPLGQLRGEGRFRDIDTTWGEWSMWLGPKDTFVVYFADTAPPAETETAIVIDLPAFYAGNSLIDIEPIEFLWKSRRTMACIA